MESSSVTILRGRTEIHSEDTRSDSDTLCENRITTEVRLVHDWTDTGNYDSEERKITKGEIVFLITSMRDLITHEGAAVACSKRRDALCFIRFMIEQISVPALNTCVKIIREGDERAKALLLLAL